MLNRHRILLTFLYFGQSEGRKGLSRTRLMKYAFLLSRDCTVLPEPARYGFVPYKYGPFSFALYRDLETLRQSGHIVGCKDCEPLEVAPDTIKETRRQVDELPQDVVEAVFEVVQKYRDVTQDDLLRDVYHRFPWYAVNSNRKDLGPDMLPDRPFAPIAVYTIGYEGHSVDTFFDSLMRAGVRVMLDVRHNPVSRKYGFARSSMSSTAQKLSIAYFHLPRLGIEGQRRKGLQTASDYRRLFDWYEASLCDRKEAIEEAVELMTQDASVLVCAEKSPDFCHRSRLAEAIADRARLEVHHLGI